MDCSRRSVLGWTGAAVGLAATAGCLTLGGSREYRLVASDVRAATLGEAFIQSEPMDVRAETRVDVDAETKRAVVDELFETGRATATEWPLVERRDWGHETRPSPTYLERDGTYYEVTAAETRRVERERWAFALERMDDAPPDGATVASEPFRSLSEDDREVIQAALDAVYAGHDGFLGDPEFDELQTVEFHDDLPVEESDLVPSPPFEYVEARGEDFRVVTEQRTVSVPEYTYSIEPIGEDRSALDAHANETVPDVNFVEVDLSADARQVLDDAVSESDPRTYVEDPPLSDGLATVLDVLGIAGDLQPLAEYEERVAFRDAIGAYEGEWYRFDLLATP